MAAKRRNLWNCTTDGKRRRLVSHVSCEICDSTFITQCDLKIHQREKHDGNQWKCKICSLEMKFSRSDLGKYTHFCEKKLAKKSRHPAPSYVSLIGDFK